MPEYSNQEWDAKPSFAKWLLLRLSFVLALLFIYFVFHAVLISSSSSRSGDLEQVRFETQILDPSVTVMITLENQMIHLPNCSWVQGPTEKMNYGPALGKGYQSCPNCIGKD